MNVLAFIVAIVALAVFTVEYIKSKSLVALGLAFTVAFIVIHFVWKSTTTVSVP